MPHSCALRGMKLVLFLDVSTVFIKKAQRIFFFFYKSGYLICSMPRQLDTFYQRIESAITIIRKTINCSLLYERPRLSKPRLNTIFLILPTKHTALKYFPCATSWQSEGIQKNCNRLKCFNGSFCLQPPSLSSLYLRLCVCTLVML